MRLTTYTDFCVRVLIYVGLNDDRPSTTKEIADAYGVSKNHLMKVVYDLGVKGYLNTTRGRNGGIRLGRPAAQINLGALIRDTEDSKALTECLPGGDGQCHIQSACVMRGVMAEALGEFFAVLDRHTLADLLEQRDGLRQLFVTRVADII